MATFWKFQGLEYRQEAFQKPLKKSEEDEKHFKQAEECHICGRSHTEKDTRVRDHCHITGKCRGSAHQDCNVNHFGLKFEDMKILFIFIICKVMKAIFSCKRLVKWLINIHIKEQERRRQTDGYKCHSKQHGRIHGFYVGRASGFLW